MATFTNRSTATAAVASLSIVFILAMLARALNVRSLDKTGNAFGAVLAKAAIIPPASAALLLAVGWCVKAWV